MIGSLFTGISGLTANAQAMQVLGDNIANVNTTAYKSNRSLFGDIISQAIEGGAFRKLAMGRGVTLMSTNPLWTQGSLETTGRTTDMAISGRGLFVVGARNEAGETTQILYSRDGSFNFDKDGYLVNSQGYVLKGYKISEEGTAVPTLTDIYIPSGASPPKVTSKMTTHLNLNADSSGGTQAYGVMEGGVGTPNADVTFTALATGTAGNGIKVIYQTGSSLSVAVSGDKKTITVTYVSGTTTAKDIENLINNDPEAGGIVKAKAEGDGSGKISTTSTLTLSGGGEPTKASLTMDCGTDETSDVVFTAKEAGSAGNAITIQYKDPGLANQSLSVSVNNNSIVISLATDASGKITTTAQDIINAINADPQTSALVQASQKGQNANGVVEAKQAVSLTGGMDSYPDTFSSTITVYDSIGNPIELTIDFTCIEPGKWSWVASVPKGVGVTTSKGTIQFDEYGNLDVQKSGGGNPVISIDLMTGANSPLNVEWELVDSTGASNGTITGYGTPSAMTFQSQDGYAAGMVTSVSVDEKGVISGVYSNGRMVPLYQIVLADFPSYAGLDRVGNNMYAESIASGQATIGVPSSGVLGTISPGTLEMSNVDLAEQFVKMITTQRAFQANSRVITTSDDILQELMALKR